MSRNIELYKTWGAYFSYPQCCVDAFIKEEQYHESVFSGSGFLPCTSCHEETKDMSTFQLIAWLGRDPWLDTDGIKDTIDRVVTEKFRNLSDLFGLDHINYRCWLEDMI